MCLNIKKCVGEKYLLSVIFFFDKLKENLKPNILATREDIFFTSWQTVENGAMTLCPLPPLF